MSSNIVQFDAWRYMVYSSITASYTKLGTVLAHPVRLLHFINSSNGVLALSTDGTTDMIPILANGFNLYDLTSDQDQNEEFRLAKGTQLWVKYISAPTIAGGATSGIYAVCVYGKDE